LKKHNLGFRSPKSKVNRALGPEQIIPSVFENLGFTGWIFEIFENLLLK